MKNNNESTLKWRVTQLEANYDRLDGKLDKILVNDLPHLSNSISSLKTKINILTVVNVGAIILAAVISKIFIL